MNTESTNSSGDSTAECTHPALEWCDILKKLFCTCCACPYPAHASEEDPTTTCEQSSDAGSRNKCAPPTVEDIGNEWQTFNLLLRNRARRKVFLEFLRSENSEKFLDFWMACEDLKKTKNVKAVTDKAKIIYNMYIAELAPKRMSVDSTVSNMIRHEIINMEAPTPYTFDGAQLQIFNLMFRDYYPRFIISSPFNDKLVRLPFNTPTIRRTHV